MNKGIGWIVKGLLFALLQARYPAAAPAAGLAWPQWEDPAYAVYQRYRYAYDTYGYLFLSESTGAAEEAGEQEEPSGEEREEEVWEAARLLNSQDLVKQYYIVHASTKADASVLNGEALLGTDLRLEKDASAPQILIYHTHSQETYADYGPGNPEATVVEAGELLAGHLRERGWNVIHDTSAYDVAGGKLDRSRAYTYALEGITRILQENPTIQVVLDIHRDGVAEGTRLVTQVNGKDTANIMFFQGMSQTPDGPIEYLPNPCLKENLAFSFQMQLEAAVRYPGFTRKIFLKGLRYNLHLRPRSALIEVGAQTNTGQEAMNAMEPLAELLNRVLQGN